MLSESALTRAVSCSVRVHSHQSCIMLSESDSHQSCIMLSESDSHQSCIMLSESALTPELYHAQ